MPVWRDRDGPGADLMPPRSGPSLVVGYDGSPASRCAVALAAARAGRHGNVCIVHAYEEGPDLSGVLAGEDDQSRRREQAQAILDGLLLLDAEELLETHCETALVAGRPAAVLTDLARDRDADEIVLGARGLGRVHALLGSVSHEVLHLADRPVLVIPANSVSTLQRWWTGGSERRS
ncbi:MAG: universal stress protein [Solirubrobacteraceae bacterium]